MYVRVGLPTFLETLPAKINAIVGQNLELRCYAASEDRLDVAYVWYHNGLKLHTTQNIYSLLVSIGVRFDVYDFYVQTLYIAINSQVVNGGSLTIYNMSFANAGVYQCVVKTVVGSISTGTELHVEGPPSPPGMCLD